MRFNSNYSFYYIFPDYDYNVFCIFYENVPNSIIIVGYMKL